jgi:hypothetical protein
MMRDGRNCLIPGGLQNPFDPPLMTPRQLGDFYRAAQFAFMGGGTTIQENINH